MVDVLQYFEGLSREQAQELRELVPSLLEDAREKVTAGVDIGEIKKKGKKKMSDEIQLSEKEIELVLEKRRKEQGSRFSEEEKRIIADTTEHARRQIEELRIAPQIDLYMRAMRNAPRGVSGRETRAKIKKAFRAQGVPVDNIDFS